MRRIWLLRVLLAPVLALLAMLIAVPARASAAPGDLSMLPGTDGCYAAVGVTPFGAATGACATTRAFEKVDNATMAPDGKTVYLATNDRRNPRLDLLRRDPETGALESMPGRAGCWDSSRSAGECSSLGTDLNPRYTGWSEMLVAGNFLYVASGGPYQASGIEILRIAEDGTLSEAGCVREYASGGCDVVPGITGITAMAASPDGKQLYVLSGREDMVTVSRDPQTGLLSPPPPGGCRSVSGDYPFNDSLSCPARRGSVVQVQKLVPSSDGKHVYAVGLQGILVFERDATTGTLSQVAGPAGCITENERTGSGCTVDSGAGGSEDAVLAPGGGQLLAPDRYSGLRVYDRDADTGALTVAECFGSANGSCTNVESYSRGPSRIVVSPDGTNVYTFGTEASVQGFARDTATGALTRLAAPGGCVAQSSYFGCRATPANPAPSFLLIDPSGRNLYGGGYDSTLAVRREVPDLQGPEVLITNPPAQAPAVSYTQGEQVAAAYTCTDDVAIASCTGPVASGQNIDTSQVGANQRFEVVAVDTAGHETRLTRFYTVVAGESPPAPQVVIDTPSLSVQTFQQGERVTASYHCTNDTSCVGPVASGALLDTATVGRNQPFEVVARNAAGNEERRTHFYTVVARPAASPSPPAAAPRPATPPPVAAPRPATPPAPQPTPTQQAQARLGAPATSNIRQQPGKVKGDRLLKPRGSLESDITVPEKTEVRIALQGQLTSGGNVVASGGGNVIAAGGGNVVAGGGGNVVAAGGGNLVQTTSAGLRSSLAATISAKKKRKKKAKLVTMAKGSRYFAKAGKGKVKVKLTKQGRALIRKQFKRRGKQKVTLTFAIGLTERGSGGPTVVTSKKLTIKE